MRGFLIFFVPDELLHGVTITEDDLSPIKRMKVHQIPSNPDFIEIPQTLRQVSGC
jgi:hypothetical protein